MSLRQKRSMSIARAAVRQTASIWNAHKAVGKPADAVFLTKESIREGHPARRYVLKAWKQYTKKLTKGTAKKKFMTNAYRGYKVHLSKK